MSTSQRRGLPRPFIAVAVLCGLAAVAYTALSFASLAAGRTERTETTTAAVDHLRIDAGSGDVTVIGEPRSDIRIVAKVRRGLWDARQRQRLAGDRLELTTDCSFFAQLGFGGNCDTSYEVRVPLATEASVRVSSGDAMLSGLRGADVSASSGDVRVDDVTGPLRVRVSSGDVRVAGYRGTDAEVRASSGDVEVRAQAAPRRIDVEVSSGDVAIVVPDVAYRVEADTRSGDEDVQVRQDPGAPRVIRATTSSGDLKVARLGDAR